jgi:hypothetical protein
MAPNIAEVARLGHPMVCTGQHICVSKRIIGWLEKRKNPINIAGCFK